MDIQLDLRMTWKRLESESKRSIKEVDKNMAKAKEALKKNNEEGAKLFL
jgi:charged multivesicular body protein 1